MSDTVTNDTIIHDVDRIKVHLTCISDGSGETNVVKIDKSALNPGDRGGKEPVALDIISVRWAIQGGSYVKLSWDHAVDSTAMILENSGYEDFSDAIAEIAGRLVSGGKLDPKTSDGTGDLLLTSVGFISGGSYDITIECKKRSAV